MNDFPFATIGFDLDGTLVDSALDLGPAINHALALAGRPAVPLSSTRNLIGGGSRMMLKRALDLTGGPLPEARHEEIFAALLDYYEGTIALNTRPYPGCIAALDRLASAHGCVLAVVTNKPERLALKLLRELDMLGKFACVIGGDTLGPGRSKPAPDMIYEAIGRSGRDGRFAMVGDSSFDVRAAQAASVPSILLSFGYNDAAPLDLGADAVIDHFDELVPALARL